MNEPTWWRPFATPPFAITLLLMCLAVYATIVVLTGSFSDDLKAGVVVALVITGVSEIRKYWLTSTSDSEKKNDTIATLAKGNNGKEP